MKIEIEISEEDAALLWDNCHRGKPVEEIVQSLAKLEADVYRESFPSAVPGVLADYRQTHR